VEKLILSLSEGAQLGEDQQLDLLKSIRSVPPPSPPPPLSLSLSVQEMTLSSCDVSTERPTGTLLSIARGATVILACRPWRRRKRLLSQITKTIMVTAMRTERARQSYPKLPSSKSKSSRIKSKDNGRRKKRRKRRPKGSRRKALALAHSQWREEVYMLWVPSPCL
jgi:hypothetical protein